MAGRITAIFRKALYLEDMRREAALFPGSDVTMDEILAEKWPDEYDGKTFHFSRDDEWSDEARLCVADGEWWPVHCEWCEAVPA